MKVYTANFILQDETGKEIHREASPSSLEPIMKRMNDIVMLDGPYRAAYLRYVTTYGTITDEARARIEELTEKLGGEGMDEREEASEKLINMGYPAYAVLSRMKKIKEAEVRVRVGTILRTLGRWNKRLTEEKGRNIPVLLRLLKSDDSAIRKSAEATLRSVLPIPTPASWKELETWWEENGFRYSWDYPTKKYVARK